MPELFRAFGYSFFFFSKEHEPIHIHVMGNNAQAKFVWNGVEFVLTEQTNIKAGDLKKIATMVEENSDLIVDFWKNYFKQK